MKKVNVFGLSVPIIQKKGLVASTGCMAYFDPVSKTIVMDASLSKEEYLSTLIHEVIHAVFHRAGLSQAKISASVQEIICEQIATTIFENFSLGPKRKR